MFVNFVSFLLVSLFLNEASAIACYQCSGKYDANCLNGTNLEAFECNFMTEQQKHLGVKCASLIVASKDGNYAEMIRTCISKQASCSHPEEYLDIQMYHSFECEYCETNGCNNVDFTDKLISIRLDTSTASTTLLSINGNSNLLLLMAIVFIKLVQY